MMVSWIKVKQLSIVVGQIVLHVVTFFLIEVRLILPSSFFYNSLFSKESQIWVQYLITNLCVFKMKCFSWNCLFFLKTCPFKRSTSKELKSTDKMFNNVEVSLMCFDQFDNYHNVFLWQNNHKNWIRFHTKLFSHHLTHTYA